MATLIERLREQIENEDEFGAFGADGWGGDNIFRQAADALEKLLTYAGHAEDCDIMVRGVWSDPLPCTCGLTQLLKDIGHADT